MYAMDDEEDCPVKSLKLYLSKLNPACESLFQRSNIASNPVQWYDRVPVGKVTLGEFMGKLSLEAGCSQHYTNHCIRASTITVLKHSGVSESDICSVTGHKCKESIKQYCKEPSDVRKRELSTILYKKCKVDGPSSSVDSSPPCSRSSVVTQRVSHCESGNKAMFAGAVFNGPVNFNFMNPIEQQMLEVQCCEPYCFVLIKKMNSFKD